MRERVIKSKYNNEITSYSMIGIPLIIWTIFFLVPLFRALYLSFTDWDLLGKASFIGFNNYIEIFSEDQIAKNAILNTVIWTIFMTIGPVLIGFITAYMIKSLPKGQKFFRAALFWPTLVSPVIGAQIQKYIFNASPFGLMNTILQFLGINPKGWYTDPNMSLFTLIIYPFFLGFGVKMLIFLSGLNQIPKPFYEAAEIDGATPFVILRKITLPLLKPVIIMNLVLSLIEGFRILTPMQLITKGGPFFKTYSVTLYIYNLGFTEYKMGYACAVAFVLFAIILAVTIIQLKLQGEEVSYE